MRMFGERLGSAIDAWRGGGRRPFAREMKDRGVSGHSYRTLFNYLKGATEPSRQWIEVAAEVLGVRVEWLKEGNGERALEAHLRSPETRDTPDSRESWFTHLEEPFHDGLSRPTIAVLSRTAAVLASTGEVRFRPGQTLDRNPEFMIWLNDYLFALRILRTWIEAQPASLLPLPDWDPELFDHQALQALLTFKQLMADARIDVSINGIREAGELVKEAHLSSLDSPDPWFSDVNRKEVPYGETEEELVQDD